MSMLSMEMVNVSVPAICEFSRLRSRRALVSQFKSWSPPEEVFSHFTISEEDRRKEKEGKAHRTMTKITLIILISSIFSP